MLSYAPVHQSSFYLNVFLENNLSSVWVKGKLFNFHHHPGFGVPVL